MIDRSALARPKAARYSPPASLGPEDQGMTRRFLLLLWLAGLAACKGPEDRLSDIGRSLAPDWNLD